LIGGFGRLFFITELGKTFGEVPLGLMSVVPGNQSYFLIENTFNNLNFYEFVTDQYATVQLEHHFNGRLFSRVPWLRRMNLREIVGVKGVIGSVSDENRAINASNLIYVAPDKPYWEYSVGVGNIFKVLRIDATWRGNYRDVPGTNNFTIKGSFGFYF
ncbi:MAG: carboxypeptidase-like regulatory domain-containing protein, partial [Flavobacterium sp.]